MQYVQDYDETYPMGVQEIFWQDTWYFLVQPYVKSVDVFRCSNDPLDYDLSQSWAGPRVSYAANGYIAWTGSNFDLRGLMADTANYLTDPNNPYPTTTLSSIRYPTETVALTEKLHVFKISPKAFGNGFNAGRGCLFIGVNWWNSALDTGPVDIPDGTRPKTADPYDPAGPNGSVTAVHSGFANVAFADGHAKSMKPAQTNPGTAGAVNMWDAYRK